ncbi:MAG: ABC transporter substrate-binding protein [Phycisphaeraceae bacterium]
MRFPYGQAPLAILILALLAGAGVWYDELSRHAGVQPDLVFATFVKEHADAYAPIIEQFERDRGVRVQLQVVEQQALQSRLQSAMQVGAEVPDMVELIYDSLGVFTKGPLDEVGFLDLTDRVHDTGLIDDVVASRFGKWSDRGHVFALPHDVHPVMLAYRRDLVEELGIDVGKLTTWEEFARVGREVVTKDLNGDGVPDRYMIDLPSEGRDALRLLLIQHGGQIFDSAGDVAFDRESTVDVFLWYVRQVQGPDRIAFYAGWGQNLARVMMDGLCLFYICPDWRTRQFQLDVPQLKGKMALMPLPAWEEGGVRTSTWGGTGLAITKRTRNPALAWDLAMHLYFNAEEQGRRFKQTQILSPLRSAWDEPAFDEPNAYFSGQKIGRMYAELAPQVPEEQSNAYMSLAVGKLSEAFANVALYHRRKGDAGLRDYARAELKRVADHVRKVMARNVFLQAGDPSDEPSEAPSGGAL